MFTINFIVQDSSGAPIPRATVFLNGSVSVGITNSSGSLSVTQPIVQSTNNFQVTAPGYQTTSGSIPASLSTTFTVTLHQTASAAQKISFVLGTPGASYTVTGPSGFTDSGVTDSNGSVQQTTATYLAGGPYSITWTLGTNTRTDSFTVLPNKIQYTFNPLNIADKSTTSGGVSSGKQAAATSTIPAPAASTPYPFTFPPYNYGKYFTPTQALMYIGEIFVDELVGFQYTLQDNRVPVFGYCSNLMDGVGNGKSIIQGQFSINFISEGYLYVILNEHNKKTAAVSTASTSEQSAIKLYQQYLSLSKSPNEGATQNQLAAIRSQLDKLVANDPKLPSVLATALNQSNQQQKYNATYRNIPFDIKLVFEGGGRTVTKTIKNCILTANEQTLSDSDTTVFDSYSFLARSIN